MDCISSLVYIKQIDDIFNTKLPVQINIKQPKENRGFSLFSRTVTPQQRSIPVLYQWFKLYYQAILNKVTFYCFIS
jgi:hypothetical protein